MSTRDLHHYKAGGRHETADYMLAEWRQQIHVEPDDTFTFKLTPKAAGSFVFNVRSTLSSDTVNYVNAPTTSVYTDQQQGWCVQQYTINVTPNTPKR